MFTPAAGIPGSVFVPAGAQVAAGETVFQTEAAFAVSPAALKAVFSIVPQEDLLLDHLPALNKPDTALLFTRNALQKNLQEHTLYLGDPDLFNLEAARPRVIWNYSRSAMGQSWGRLSPDDGTVGLIRTGVLTFLGPSDAAPLARFGKTLSWVRAVDLEDRFGGGESSEAEEAASETTPPGPLEPCPEAVLAFRALFPFAPQGQVPVPQVSGIYPNAAWTLQAESILGELFGSSEGTASQSFRLTRVPVISALVWVDELGSLTDEEIAQLKADPAQFQEEADPAGNRLALWVRWAQVADLALTVRDDRVYFLDPVQGTLLFGDGLHGKVPPVGRDNLKADYQVGGGSSGNVGVGKIKTLKSSFAGIDKVTSPNRLVVGGPVYLLLSVTVDLYSVSLDVAAAVEKRALEQLAIFLHPLTGGLEEKGWQFGQVPCLSDILALLHGIEGVDHLENLSVQVKETQSGEAVLLMMDGMATLTPSPYTLISSGEHQIQLKVKEA